MPVMSRAKRPDSAIFRYLAPAPGRYTQTGTSLFLHGRAAIV
jgi:hypothetical protein